MSGYPPQPYILQSGTITPGHGLVWAANGVVEDSGSPPIDLPSGPEGYYLTASGIPGTVVYVQPNSAGGPAILDSNDTLSEGLVIPAGTTIALSLATIAASQVANGIPAGSSGALLGLTGVAGIGQSVTTLKNLTIAANASAFTTVAALRAGGYSFSQNQSVHLPSFPFPHVWQAASTATDDGAITINPTGNTGAGRWVMDYSGDVQLEWYQPDFTGASYADMQLAAAIAACGPNGTVRSSTGGTLSFQNPITKTQSYNCFSIRFDGAGGQSAGLVLNYSAIAADSTFLTIVGGSGQTCYAIFENLTFVGNSTSTAISIQGQDGIRIKNCQFGTNAVGVDFYNNLSGSFTEFNEIQACTFSNACQITAQYRIGSGKNSFHGSGFSQKTIIHTGTANTTGAVVIGAGCLVYNAPFDVQWFKGSTAAPLILNNSGGGGLRTTTYGSITVETGSSVTTLATGGNVYHAGKVNSLGTLYYGTLFLVDTIVETGPENTNNGGALAQLVSIQGAKTFGNSSFTGALASTGVLTVSGTFSGANLSIGSMPSGASTPAGLMITSFLTGTGTTGTYQTNTTGTTIAAEAMTVTSTAIGYGVFNCGQSISQDISVELLGANYAYAYDLKTRFVSSLTEEGVVTVASFEAFNSAGWGPPVFSINANGLFVISNSNASFSVQANLFIKFNGQQVISYNPPGQYLL